ncbi:MAG: putative motility protein [Deferribacterales bacterium]
MDLASLSSAASQMKQAEVAYAASIKVAKMALDAQEMTGSSVLSILEGGSVNKAQSGAETGSLIDVIA